MNNVRCPHCQKCKPTNQFFKNSARKSGVSTLCKSCFSAYEGTPERRAKRTWNTMRARVKRQSSYSHVEVNMTRDEYLEWAIPAYTEWMHRNPNETPSIDRIDPAKHYETGNLRIIERGENARLASNHPNVHAPEGKAWCHSCDQYLPKGSFWKCKTNFNGLQKRCIPCQRASILRSKERSANKRA